MSQGKESQQVEQCFWGEQAAGLPGMREHDDLRNCISQGSSDGKSKKSISTSSNEKAQFLGSLINLWVDLAGIRDGKMQRQKKCTTLLIFASAFCLSLWVRFILYFYRLFSPYNQENKHQLSWIYNTVALSLEKGVLISICSNLQKCNCARSEILPTFQQTSQLATVLWVPVEDSRLLSQRQVFLMAQQVT